MTQKDTTVDGKNLGFATARDRVVANRQFLQANPAAKRWFEIVRIPFEDIITSSKLAHSGQSRPKDVRRLASEWVKNHQQQFDSWIEEAKKARK